MITLAPITVTAAQFTVTLPIHDPTGYTALVMNNESAFQLAVQFDGATKTINAWESDVVPLNGRISSINVTPTLALPNTPQPNNILSCDLYDSVDAQPSLGSYPAPLQRIAQSYGQSSFLGSYGASGHTSDNKTFTLPPNTQALLIASKNAAVLNNILVQGVTTGFAYYNGPALVAVDVGANQLGSIVVAVAPGADSQVTCTTSNVGIGSLDTSTSVVALSFAAPTNPALVVGGSPPGTSTTVIGVEGNPTGQPLPVALPTGPTPAISYVSLGASVAAGSTATLIAGVAGKTIQLYSIFYHCDTGNVAGVFQGNLQDSAGVSIFDQYRMSIATAVGNCTGPQRSIICPVTTPLGLIGGGRGLVFANSAGSAGNFVISGIAFYRIV